MLSASVRDAERTVRVYTTTSYMQHTNSYLSDRHWRVFLPITSHCHVRIRCFKSSRIFYNDVSHGDDLHAYEQRAEVSWQGAYTVLRSPYGEERGSDDS